MRKRNCDKLFDNVMWYLIYLFPLIITLFVYNNPEALNMLNESSGYTPTDIGPLLFEILETLGISIDSGTIGGSFFTVLEQFGTNGDEVWLASYLAYFVIVYCAHLMVDFILFIPRLAHKWMNDFTKGD